MEFPLTIYKWHHLEQTVRAYVRVRTYMWMHVIFKNWAQRLLEYNLSTLPLHSISVISYSNEQAEIDTSMPNLTHIDGQMNWLMNENAHTQLIWMSIPFLLPFLSLSHLLLIPMNIVYNLKEESRMNNCYRFDVKAITTITLV